MLKCKYCSAYKNCFDFTDKQEKIYALTETVEKKLNDIKVECNGTVYLNFYKKLSRKFAFLRIISTYLNRSKNTSDIPSNLFYDEYCNYEYYLKNFYENNLFSMYKTYRKKNLLKVCKICEIIHYVFTKFIEIITKKNYIDEQGKIYSYITSLLGLISVTGIQCLPNLISVLKMIFIVSIKYAFNICDCEMTETYETSPKDRIYEQFLSFKDELKTSLNLKNNSYIVYFDYHDKILTKLIFLINMYKKKSNMSMDDVFKYFNISNFYKIHINITTYLQYAHKKYLSLSATINSVKCKMEINIVNDNTLFSDAYKYNVFIYNLLIKKLYDEKKQNKYNKGKSIDKYVKMFNIIDEGLINELTISFKHFKSR